MVCVVVDEAHRATGNYAYCGVVRAVHAATAGRARILALSATPGKDCKTLQAIVSNLLVAHIEFRDELSADVAAYTHRKEVSIVSVPVCAELARLRERLAKVTADLLKRLTSKRVFYEVDPSKTSVHALQKARAPTRTRRGLATRALPVSAGSFEPRLRGAAAPSRASDSRAHRAKAHTTRVHLRARVPARLLHPAAPASTGARKVQLGRRAARARAPPAL